MNDIIEAGENKALLISATGERDIFMTGERNQYLQGFWRPGPKYVRGNLIGIFAG